ncbi:carbohydrate ABC transporter permease [Halopelagius longus]|uniref:Carbohydrate ABC transporter membrane protein 2, CUT1 family n=1 Tax=Halopelagius longus TaxID=1236180 RepID=A0A1H1G5U5_9EURY|nr:carbohydrate ABC transporter permease [Halopelagius longus]RDI69823.1 carbohydrate ABC transporter permease [Halopelagius longus]SDR08607.1 carbohydrate ABC transporter membrane protein 2, CUT1 family [Halopelagius longus]
MRQETKREALWKFGGYIFLLTITALVMIPIYWMIVAATIPQSEFFSWPPRLLPGIHYLENFRALQENVDFVRSIGNSLIISVSYTALSLVLCSMAGFAFAKYDFKFKEPLFYFILATLVLPIQLLIIPLFLLMTQLGWTNSYLAVILPWAANPLGIFLMRQNMKAIPDALLESARMDGATEFQLYYKIALPTMLPSLAALAIILFLNQWQAFLYPLVILQEEEMFTIPLALAQLVGQQRVYFDQVMVATSLGIIPIFLTFIFLQQYFIKGILSGSVKQ